MSKLFWRYFLTTSVLLFGAGAVLLLSLSSLSSYYFGHLSQKEWLVPESMVEIPFGSSLKRVSELLEQNRVIDNARTFYWYCRLGRLDSYKMQAGFYEFSGAQSYGRIAERLLHGVDQSLRLTFKEGQTLNDLVASLSALGLVTTSEFEEAMKDPEILAGLFVPTQSRTKLYNDTGGIEGYLFPDTYFFSKKDNAKTIIKKMHQRLKLQLSEPIQARMRELNMPLHKVLTLASIIEKETGDKSERELISSVYHNRLKLGMRLQADPTVIYGIKDYGGKIRKIDLLTHHPYNTYTMKGLPPGPIAAPGFHSIQAALWPKDTNFLYFVSKNDGTHEFCADLDCHNRAVKIWQIDFFKRAQK